MPDQFRLRHTDVSHLVAEVAPGTTVQIGDLVYLDSGKLRPAADLPDQGTLEANQARFATAFFGVAMQAATGSGSVLVRVAADGVFEMDCAARSWQLGELVAAAEQPGGTALENQQVAPAARPELALGYVVQDYPTATTRVKVRLVGRPGSLLQLLRLERRQTANVETLAADKTLTPADARIQVLDPADAAGRSVTLPPEAASAGVDFFLHNAADAAEPLTVKNGAGTTVCTVGQNQAAYLHCDGTTWWALVGASN